MANIQANTIPNARKLIKDALINFYKKRGMKPRDDFFKPGLDALKLTKEQLAERHSSGIYAKYRALTGTIINELTNAHLIYVKDIVETTMPTKNPEHIKQSLKKVDAQKPTSLNLVAQRRKIIDTIAARYLTLEEQKNGTQYNKLKAFVNTKTQAKYIANENFEEVLEHVEQWFLKTTNISQSLAKSPKKKYPSTDIGNCLKQQYQIYLRLVSKNIKLNQYNKELDHALITAIQILGGAFFEKHSLEVIKKVYGSRVVTESDKIVGGANDHGIDARLKISDEFGMQDTVYIQSKLSEKGEKAIREFIGTLTIENGNKGIFISAGSVSATTRKYFETRSNNFRISIIGREELLAFMKQYQVGVKIVSPDVYIVDDDYFLSE